MQYQTEQFKKDIESKDTQLQNLKSLYLERDLMSSFLTRYEFFQKAYKFPRIFLFFADRLRECFLQILYLFFEAYEINV